MNNENKLRFGSNFVYQVIDTKAIHRVLYVESMSFVYTIDVNEPIIWPKQRAYQNIVDGLDSNKLEPFSDPFVYLLRPDSEFAEKDLAHRDRAWDVITELVFLNKNGELFHRRQRGKIINLVHQDTGVSAKTIRKYLRQYWQRGMVKNSLIGNYTRCGGKGNVRQYHVKNGRRSKREIAESRLITRPLSEDDKIKMALGIQKFHLSGNKYNLRDSYTATMGQHYSRRIYDDEKRCIRIELEPEHKRPTQRQFHYFYQKMRDPVQEKILRDGYRRYYLNHRAVLKDSIMYAPGPLSVGQIDATQMNIYLVSRITRKKIIGRPILYILQDVFSRYITIIISMGHASLRVGTGVITTMCMDKEELCRKANITYVPEEWPCGSGLMFKKIMTDNAEFESINADTLTSAFNVSITQHPPYRADVKGIVERTFDIVDNECIKFLPGYVDRKNQRGDKDYRLSASLTLPELLTILLEYVIYFNNNRQLKHYRMSEAMLADDVKPYPADIWRWGMENITGFSRRYDPESVRRALLPREKASVTEKGIYYKGLYFTHPMAVKERWFDAARIDGRKKIDITVDPFSTKHIYMEVNGKHEKCPLIQRTGNQIYDDWDWHEAMVVMDDLDVQIQKREQSELEGKILLHTKRDEIVKRAVKERKDETAGMTKTARIKGIGKNRRLEHGLEVVEDSTSHLSPDSPGDDAKPQSKTNTRDYEYDPPADYSDQLS